MLKGEQKKCLGYQLRNYNVKYCVIQLLHFVVSFHVIGLCDFFVNKKPLEFYFCSAEKQRHLNLTTGCFICNGKITIHICIGLLTDNLLTQTSGLVRVPWRSRSWFTARTFIEAINFSTVTRWIYRRALAGRAWANNAGMDAKQGRPITSYADHNEIQVSKEVTCLDRALMA